MSSRTMSGEFEFGVYDFFQRHWKTLLDLATAGMEMFPDRMDHVDPVAGTHILRFEGRCIAYGGEVVLD